MEHPLIDVVCEHEDAIYFARRAARCAYVRERHDAKRDRTEPVPKNGQGVDDRGVVRDGIGLHGTDSETQNIRATES